MRRVNPQETAAHSGRRSAASAGNRFKIQYSRKYPHELQLLGGWL
jgi:hypothetical protein